MESSAVRNSTTDNKVKQLDHILQALQLGLQEFIEEVQTSSTLHKLGVKTPLVEHIENTINNPLSHLFKVSSNIDSDIKNIVEFIIMDFLKGNTSLIFKAFINRNTSNILHYSIILKEDTLENRDKIFAFHDFFSILEISQKYSVAFQFVPMNLIDKINVKKEIVLNEVDGNKRKPSKS